MTHTDKPLDTLRLGSVQAAEELRRQAEETFRQKTLDQPKSPQPMSAEETSRVLHELQVHQIQLEMQNEELRRAQVELDRTRARYFNLYDQAPVGYCTISENGVFLEANLTAATLLGLGRGALVGQTISFFIYQEDQDIYEAQCKRLFATGEPQVCELRMLRPNGSSFWAHLETTAVRDEDQALLCRIVLTDVTERKSAEEEKAKLLALNRQMQTAESLGRMAGAIAHHFNNKLHVVQGFLELTMSGLPPGDPAIYNLTAAMQATDKAAEVSRMMLTYLGRVNDQQETLDLSEICRMSMPVLQAAMPKNVVLETDLPSPGPTIKANANQIHQILSHLTTNAWEATGDESASISMTVKTVISEAIADLHRFPCTWQPEDSPYVCLEVRDSGCGIAEHDVEKVFDPFFSTKFIGRGLGLAMVLGLV